MNVELIIFLVVWLISTEFMFFKFVRKMEEKFIPSKILSIFSGALIAFFLFGIPSMFASGMGYPEDAIGNIMYVWYYGIIFWIGVFFLVNYKIHKRLEKKEKKKKRGRKR